jgi:hypothetical protein
LGADHEQPSFGFGRRVNRYTARPIVNAAADEVPITNNVVPASANMTNPNTTTAKMPYSMGRWFNTPTPDPAQAPEHRKRAMLQGESAGDEMMQSPYDRQSNPLETNNCRKLN